MNYDLDLTDDPCDAARQQARREAYEKVRAAVSQLAQKARTAFTYSDWHDIARDILAIDTLMEKNDGR